ncbi:MAG: hypothetical protein EOM68_02215 [Spirochaetia bacterium]|nr:hypothetical protein [Spirochaetia bacterium]
MKPCTYTLMTTLLLLLLSTSCGCNQQGPEITNLFAQKDSTPPKLLSAKAIDTATISIRFSEELHSKSIKLEVNGVKNTNYLCVRDTLMLYLTSPMEIASSTRLEGRVEDPWGNSTSFAIDVWAHNPNRAGILINEFSTKGSANNPDRVELRITKAGNLAGITIANGVGPSAKDRCILGDKKVFAGDFVVIAFQQGDAGIQNVSEQTGGLSSNNGCITVTESPDWESPILDAVIYSNKTTSTHGGFGSGDTEQGARVLYEGRQWDSPLAERAIDSTDSTATRTMCRTNYSDTNSAQDWYVCDNREASFGGENSENHYQR